jgi:hypothetical protein
MMTQVFSLHEESKTMTWLQDQVAGAGVRYEEQKRQQLINDEAERRERRNLLRKQLSERLEAVLSFRIIALLEIRIAGNSDVEEAYAVLPFGRNQHLIIWDEKLESLVIWADFNYRDRILAQIQSDEDLFVYLYRYGS